jgi:hypothetical protein
MRESIKAFRNMGEQLIGAEIGVWRGENALSILQNSDMYLLYLIDPYESYNEYNKNEIAEHQNMVLNEAYAKNLLKPHKDDIVWVKQRAAGAHNYIPNDLDFVYIDGNHKKEFVEEELALYYPKVRKGGIVAGHDFHYTWIREVVMEYHKKNPNDKLYSYPFKDAGTIHNWEKEWERPETIPNKDVTTDKLDWWFVKE